MIIQESKPTSNSVIKPGVLSLAIKENPSLYLAYRSFVNDGSLFITTTKAYKMSDKRLMMLNLSEDTEKINVAGKLVGLNPIAQNGKPQGVGIQFNPDTGGRLSKVKIEALLGESLHAHHPTCILSTLC